jgi:uncharacterized protein
MFPLHLLVFPRTLALFLLGALAWRSQILLHPSENKSLLCSLATGGLLLGGMLAIAAEGRQLFGWSSLDGTHEVIERLSGVLLALGYAAIVIWLVGVPTGRRMLAWAAPVGRMAFTNYLGQSIICGWIFYAYGLGLFGKLSVIAAFTIAVAVYAVQVVVSALWLDRYRYGPVEWLWRSLMYGNWNTNVRD